MKNSEEELTPATEYELQLAAGNVPAHEFVIHQDCEAWRHIWMGRIELRIAEAECRLARLREHLEEVRTADIPSEVPLTEFMATLLPDEMDELLADAHKAAVSMRRAEAARAKAEISMSEKLGINSAMTVVKMAMYAAVNNMSLADVRKGGIFHLPPLSAYTMPRFRQRVQNLVVSELEAKEMSGLEARQRVSRACKGPNLRSILDSNEKLSVKQGIVPV